jgi:hypothetical protein
VSLTKGGPRAHSNVLRKDQQKRQPGVLVVSAQEAEEGPLVQVVQEMEERAGHPLGEVESEV